MKILIRTEVEHRAYPFREIKVPIRITGDYPTFLTAVVLSHKNPEGFAPSLPYPITIDKHELRLGIMVIKEVRT